MRSSLKKALADHKKYLKKLGLDRIKKKKKNETFIFESCENRTGVPTGDKLSLIHI